MSEGVTHKHARKRASIGVAFFAVIGALGIMWMRPLSTLIPDLIFYGVLLVNTYYSVECFALLAPKHYTQNIADAALVVSYCLAGLYLGDPLAFPFFIFLVFLIAPFKYVLMLSVSGHIVFLRKKILIDLAGTAATFAALFLALAGFPVYAAWGIALGFAAANVYLLYVKPMYRVA